MARLSCHCEVLVGCLTFVLSATIEADRLGVTDDVVWAHKAHAVEWMEAALEDQPLERDCLLSVQINLQRASRGCAREIQVAVTNNDSIVS